MKKLFLLLVLVCLSKNLSNAQVLPPSVPVNGTYFDGSSACGNVGSANWILATFNGSSNALEIGFSRGQINWCYDLLQTAIPLRDPRLLKDGSTYYVAHTDVTPGATYWGCRSSSNGKMWSSETDISVTGGGLSPSNVWAPSWFVDTDGSIHVFVSIATATNTNFQIYEQHPTGSGNLCSQTWSTPAPLTVTGEGNIIDPWVSCIDVSGTLCSSSSTGNTYYLFYTTPGSGGTEYGQYATSSSLAGTYTDQQTGNWAGWSGGTGTSIEGLQLVSTGSASWRMFFDFVNPSGTVAGQLYYSDCVAGLNCFSVGSDWSAKQPLATAPYQAKHGTVYPYP